MKTNWRTTKLIDVCNQITDGSHFSPKTFDRGLFPYITVRDIENDTIDFTNCKHISNEDYQKLLKNGCKPNKGDLLFSKDGTVGKVSLVDFERNFVVLSSLAIIRPKKEIIDSNFLKYILKSPAFFNEATGMKTGAAIRRIVLKNLKNIKISFPVEISEQQQIVKILSDAFEKIAKAKENAQKNLQNSKDIYESYLQNIFSNTNSGWIENTLGEAYDVRDGTHDSPKYQKEGYALITSKNLKNDLLDYSRVNFISEVDYKKICERSKVDKGDILFAMIGTIGNPVVVDIDPQFAIKNVALFKVPKDKDSTFLKYYLDSKFVIDKMTSEAKGTTQKFVGLGYLRNFKIMLPPIAEQKAVVVQLNNLKTKTQQMESIYHQKLINLEDLKKSILSQAFTGNL